MCIRDRLRPQQAAQALSQLRWSVQLPRRSHQFPRQRAQPRPKHPSSPRQRRRMTVMASLLLARKRLQKSARFSECSNESVANHRCKFPSATKTGRTFSQSTWARPVAGFFDCSQGVVESHLSRDFLSVSYTHLDVYKRQAFSMVAPWLFVIIVSPCGQMWTRLRSVPFMAAPSRLRMSSPLPSLRCGDCLLYTSRCV